MVRVARALRAAEPAQVAEYVKNAANKAFGQATGEGLARIKQHLSPAVAHFTVWSRQRPLKAGLQQLLF